MGYFCTPPPRWDICTPHVVNKPLWGVDSGGVSLGTAPPSPSVLPITTPQSLPDPPNSPLSTYWPPPAHELPIQLLCAPSKALHCPLKPSLPPPNCPLSLCLPPSAPKLTPQPLSTPLNCLYLPPSP